MTVRSRRNQVIGSCFLLVAIALLLLEFVSGVVVTARVLESLVALELIWVGIRLIVTSRLVITRDALIMRNKWGRKIIISRTEIASVEMGTRTFAYNRAFPRMQLQSGRLVDLNAFEQPTARACRSDSSVRRLIEALSPSEIR
jgi:hypothetical protein